MRMQRTYRYYESGAFDIDAYATCTAQRYMTIHTPLYNAFFLVYNKAR